jgi:hypothetical protein
MILRRLTVAALLASFALVAGAQTGAAGKWTGNVSTEQGPFALTFDFAVAGGTLTGNLVTDFFSAPISDGTVKGDDIAFKLKIDTPDAAMLISYTGKIAGDEINLTSKFEGAPPGGGPGEQTLKLTRAK